MQKIYFHPRYFEQLATLNSMHPLQDQILLYYSEWDGRIGKPDLYGKTVRVNERQFPKIWTIVKNVAEIGNVSPPPTFLYEDFYYGVEAKGADNPRLEISSKTINDLSETALKFLIAREICRIKWNMHKTTLALEQTFSIVESGISLTSIIPGTQTISDALRITYARWSRLSHYTADNFGYLVVRDVEICVRAILTLVLNNVKLSENINIPEYLKQMHDIYLLDDVVSRFSENDETIPYAPLRVKNLLAFAANNEVIKFKGDF